MTSDAPRSVLIVCDVVPGHRAAGEVRLVHMAMLLAEQDQVALLALDRHLDEPDDARVDALRAGGVEVIGPSGPTALRAGLAKRPYDLVVIEFWHIAERVLPLLRAKQPWAVVAVDSVDLHFLREERGESVGHVSPAGMEDRKRRELVAYGAADVRIFTSDAERERYQAEGGNAEGNLIVSIIAPATARLPRPRRPLVVFVGCFWHAPNLDGVTWFAERVWPVVRASVPDATFAVAGSRVGPEVSRLGDRERGIDVLGFVPDIGSLYDEASVAVAPLRFGAGVKGKVVEALAAGLPLVATTIAAEGLDLADGIDLCVADDAEHFADRVISILGDPAAGGLLGASGQATIQRRCGPATARAALRALSSSAVAGSGPGGRWPRRWWWLRGLPDRSWVTVRPVLAAAARAARRRAARRPA